MQTCSTGLCFAASRPLIKTVVFYCTSTEKVLLLLLMVGWDLGSCRNAMAGYGDRDHRPTIKNMTVMLIENCISGSTLNRKAYFSCKSRVVLVYQLLCFWKQSLHVHLFKRAEHHSNTFELSH